MVPAVFINCSQFPFISDILYHGKTLETRSRNTLRQIVGMPVLLAETGNGVPLIKGIAMFGKPEKVTNAARWEELRECTMIRRGSKYDWKPGTKCKWVYPVAVLSIAAKPYPAPDGVRHGRVWMECEL